MGVKRAIKTVALNLLPDLLIFRRKNRGTRDIFITFDDGPDSEYTAPILDLLAEFDAKATFFLLGKRIEKEPELARKLVEQGHVVGNHSYSHLNVRTRPRSRIVEEIEQTEALLKALDGKERHLFRPPAGRLSFKLLLATLQRKVPIAYWSLDSLDSEDGGSEKIVQRMKRMAPRGGEIILFHDDNAATLEALGQLLPYWQSQGFSFVALEGPG